MSLNSLWIQVQYYMVYAFMDMVKLYVGTPPDFLQASQDVTLCEFPISDP